MSYYQAAKERKTKCHLSKFDILSRKSTMSRSSLMLWCCVLLFVASSMESRGNFTSDSEKDDNSTIMRYELNRNRSDEAKLLFGQYNLGENSTKDDEQMQYEFLSTSFARNDQVDHESVRNETHARSTAELRGNSNKDDDKDDIVPYEMCESSVCIKLCCPLGHRLINDKCVAGKGDYLFPNVYEYTTSDLSQNVNRTELNQIFQLVIHDPCQGTQRYQLDPVEYPDDEYIFFSNGSLYKPYYDEFVQSKSYCLALLPNRNQYDVTVCFGNTTNEIASGILPGNEHTGIPVGLIISLPFLLATFVVYSILPKLRNMHGYTLRGYVGSLFVAYIVLAVLQLTDPTTMGDSTCVALAFVIHFSFLASFFWLNVMCFDIWWTFGGFRSLQGSVTQRERKKFVIYSIYAWGSASVLTIVCAIMDFVPSVPKHLIRPEFGAEKCWFTTDAAKALYFYGPMSITVVCNICLFISTALKIVRHNNDTAHHLRSSESRRHDDNKQWFNLYLKLFIVMGINWSMEIVSWLFKSAPQYVWYLTDLTNTLQGLIIFFIFVWKEKIKRLLLKRFGCQDRSLFSRNSTRSGCHSSASRTCTTTSGVMSMQEKINPYVQANCRTKNSSDETDP